MTQERGQTVLRSKTRAPQAKGLPRERLDAVLAQIWEHRLGLITAPAGSGKTTLLGHFVAAAGVPAGWYRAEPADSSAAAAVAHLERALVPALDGLRGGWTEIDDAIDALEGWTGTRGLLVVDDLHALWGTEAEGALERLLEHLPPSLNVLAATRRLPGFDLSRLRVAGTLLEITADDLRFRSWEVERLFRDVYGEHLPPNELAELARRTEGWAAGLQLFHLATSGKPAGERRRVLRELGLRSRLVREYLTRNVLDELPVHLRDFLLGTCVLGRLTPALCDELLGASSSEMVLVELERRQIFTSALDEDGAYRYHEVLRSHLEGVLVDRVGENEARQRYGRAGALLERAGDLPEALRAYCRAEDWSAATRLLGGRGEQVIDRRGEWIDALPAPLLDQDPWLLLTSARRYASLGRWEAALDTWRRAELGFGGSPATETCRRERQALAPWMDAETTPQLSEWTGALRGAVRRDPRRAGLTLEAGTTMARFVAGVGSLLAGHVVEADAVLSSVEEAADASEVISVAAAIAGAIARSLAGQSSAVDLDRTSERADAAGMPWLASLARSALALEVGAGVAPELVERERSGKEDGWANGLGDLFLAVGQLRAGLRVIDLDDALAWFEQVDAPVLQVWTLALAALAEARTNEHAAGSTARSARALARSVAAPGPLAIASAAMALVEREYAADHVAAAEAVARDTGLDISGLLLVESDVLLASNANTRAVDIRCLGGFSLQFGAHRADLSGLKPRVRSLLRLLAMHAGRPVHRELLIDQLWPDEGDVKAGTRNLQVAISALRQALEPGVSRGESAFVVREGDGYRLAIGPDGHIDIVTFGTAVDAGRAARRAGRADEAEAEFARALDAYAGPLLAEEGSAEWVLSERDRLGHDAADAAQALAELALERGDAPAAAAAAERGLRIDGYRDSLWRVLIDASEAAGDLAAAKRAKHRYEEVLKDLEA